MTPPSQATQVAQDPQATTSETAQDPRLAQLHRVMLMMLKDFAALCERENLSWMIMFGSAIGALRHGGFIPWDDDVDIAMPRADLERFSSIVQADDAMKERYTVIDAAIDPRYPLATSRLMLRNTEFRDTSLASMDFESGIFLDLFPLDNLADDERAFKRQAWRAWLYNKLAIAKFTRNPYVAGGGLRAVVLKAGSAAVRIALNLPGLRSIRLNERSLAWQTRYRSEQTQRIGYLCDTGRFWNTYDRDDLFPVRMASFEDMEVPLAHRAEKILEALYGDFMTPPPESERRAHYPEILDFGPWSHL